MIDTRPPNEIPSTGPRWSLVACLCPLFAVATGLVVVNSARSLADGIVKLMLIVPAVGVVLLVGLAIAGYSVRRRERPIGLTVLAFALNGGPLVFVLVILPLTR